MNKLLVIGMFAIGYGIFGLFYYYPSLEYIDKPFPFEHSTGITPNPDGNGYKALRYADSLVAAKIDPLWVVWSASLYFGMGCLAAFGLKDMTNRKTLKR